VSDETNRVWDDLFEGLVGAKEGAPGAVQMALDAFLELRPSYRSQLRLNATIWQARMKREQERMP
jgi:hypothetical protein